MATTDRILMCPPDHFEIDYVINPWMDGNTTNMDLAVARQQWDRLKGAIEEVAEVCLMDPQPGLPDMVFTANAGVVYGNRAMASHFLPQERRGEEEWFKRWFRDNGFDLYDLPDEIGFEGAGDALFDRGGPWLWTGYGFRTEIEAHEHLSEWQNREVVSVRLVDPRFYHIDTCMCPLNGGYLLYHPPAFDDASREAIEKRVPAEKRIPVNEKDAGHFACNAVNVGQRVIAHGMSDALADSLGEHGFEVVQTRLYEFLKAGGSAKCLTLKLTEPTEA